MLRECIETPAVLAAIEAALNTVAHERHAGLAVSDQAEAVKVMRAVLRAALGEQEASPPARCSREHPCPTENPLHRLWWGECWFVGEQEAAPSKIEQELNYWRAKAAEYAYIIEQGSISMEELAESLGLGEQEATPPEPAAWRSVGTPWIVTTCRGDYPRLDRWEPLYAAAATQGEAELPALTDLFHPHTCLWCGSNEHWGTDDCPHVAPQGEGNTDGLG